MMYIGIAPRDHRNIFMHLPENMIFTSVHVNFNKNLFLQCPTNKKQDQIPLRPAKTPLLNLDGPSDDDEDVYHYTPYSSPNRKYEKDQGRPDNNQCLHTTAQVPDPLPLIQDKEEHYCKGDWGIRLQENPQFIL